MFARPIARLDHAFQRNRPHCLLELSYFHNTRFVFYSFLRITLACSLDPQSLHHRFSKTKPILSFFRMGLKSSLKIE